MTAVEFNEDGEFAGYSCDRPTQDPEFSKIESTLVTNTGIKPRPRRTEPSSTTRRNAGHRSE